MEPILLIFLFMGVIAITALLFGAWVVFTVIRLILKGFVSLIAPPAKPRMPQLQPGAWSSNSPNIGARCANPKCRHNNPGIAQFCRRCGAALPAAQRVAVRRVAMW